MHQSFSSLLIAASFAVSLSAFANKSAPYSPSADYNPDWSQNWYLGMGVNGNAESTLNLNGSPEVFNHYSGMSGIDEVEQTGSSPGFEFYFGRAMSKYWSIELGYSLLGDMFFEGEISNLRTQKIEVTQQNIHLVALGKYPIGEIFNVFVRGGTSYLMTIQEFYTPATDDRVRDKSNTLALTYGGGIGVDLTRWGFRGEYNVIWPANDVRDDFYVADIISASIYYKFD